jgi:trafficking protein particle complex subunit 2
MEDIKFMLLHETRNDDGIRAFFNDVWECYVKTLLNPFYAVDKAIKSTVFENKVKAIAKVLYPSCLLCQYQRHANL